MATVPHVVLVPMEAGLPCTLPAGVSLTIALCLAEAGSAMATVSDTRGTAPAEQPYVVKEKGTQTSLALSGKAVPNTTQQFGRQTSASHLCSTPLYSLLRVSEDLKYKWELDLLFLLHPAARLALIPI